MAEVAVLALCSLGSISHDHVYKSQSWLYNHELIPPLLACSACDTMVFASPGLLRLRPMVLQTHSNRMHSLCRLSIFRYFTCVLVSLGCNGQATNN